MVRWGGGRGVEVDARVNSDLSSRGNSGSIRFDIAYHIGVNSDLVGGKYRIDKG